MTFREKFHKEFPKEKDFNPASKWCPSSFDYEEDWPCCPTDRNSEGMDCDKCWDRKIPERKVFYLCDGRKEECRHSKLCYKNCESDSGSCAYTTDIEHAVNFTRMGKRSKDFEERKCGNDIHFNIGIEPLGLDQEERTILMDAMERALRRIRCYRRKDAGNTRFFTEEEEEIPAPDQGLEE